MVRSPPETSMKTGVKLQCGKNEEAAPKDGKDKYKSIQPESNCNVSSSQESPYPTTERDDIGKDKEESEQPKSSLKMIKVEESSQEGKLSISKHDIYPKKSEEVLLLM